MVMVLFVCVMAVSVSFANVTTQRSQNQALHAELIRLENINSSLELQISDARNLDEVEYIARTRLNMSEPVPGQITVVNLIPKEQIVHDFTVMPEYELAFNEQVSRFFERLRVFFVGG